MSLPPFARSLDARSGWPTFAAATFSTVGDDVAREDGERYVVPRDAHRDDTDVVSYGHDPAKTWRDGAARGQSRWTELQRQAFLRRVQHVDPRERRA